MLELPRMRLAPLSVSLLLGGGSFACGERGGSVDAPAPQGEFSHDVDSLPSLPPGTIVAPLSLDLGGALAALERTVPRRFGNITQRLPMPGSKRKSYAYELARDAFKVSIRGDTVMLAAVIHYKGRAWYDPPIGPDINGECGTKGDPPRAQLVVRAIPRLTPDWKLQVRTRLMAVTPLTDTERDQCEVSFLNVDVTRRVLDGASKVLETLLPQVDRKIGHVDVRTPLNKIWSDLQKPIRLKDSLWLLLDPRAVNLGEMHGSKEAVEAEIGITAAPRIVTGPRPVFRPYELPPLGAVRTDQGFSILIEGTFDYGVMSSELTSRLAGQSVRAAGGVLEVQRVTVIGVGAGRLALGLDFDGTARGRLWLLGKPNYDAASGLLTVPDLDFDTRSAGMLLQGLAWLKAGAIRDFLRSQARVSAGPVLAMVQGLAVKQLNRTIRPGVQLSASIEHSEPAGILVRSGGLIIRARATGSARLELGPEIFATKNAEH
jgi:hypothetical protein